ncbi:MAG: hypothetical protein E7322_03790 [Clostridiales bacterium]|nr:hypothetical protein [Clostridiales bacterium]
MDNKKKPVVPMQNEIEELGDEQLSQVTGGLNIPTISGNSISGNSKPFGSKFGNALEENTSFNKSNDRLPSKNGF